MCLYVLRSKRFRKGNFLFRKSGRKFCTYRQKQYGVFNNEDIKNSKEKIDEIKNFVQKRYKKNENNDKDNIKIKKDLPKDVAI